MRFRTWGIMTKRLTFYEGYLVWPFEYGMKRLTGMDPTRRSHLAREDEYQFDYLVVKVLQALLPLLVLALHKY